MKIRRMDLYIFPLDEVHCGYGRQQGNILPSLPFIPGRVVRGGLAGWAIRTAGVKASDPIFSKIFFPEPSDPPISFPFCTPMGRVPAPLSLFEAKGRVEDPRARMIAEKTTVFVCMEREIAGKLPRGPLDFLMRKEKWPSDVDATLKPAIGSIDPDERFPQIYPAFDTVIDLKASHDDDSGRVKDKAGLFAEEAVPPSRRGREQIRYYRGALVWEDYPEFNRIFERLSNPGFGCPFSFSILEDPHPSRLMFIGHRRVAAAVYGADIQEIDTATTVLPPMIETIRTNNEFTITFMTDFIPQNGDAFPLRKEHLLPLMKLGDSPEKERVFCRRGVAHGYNVKDGKPLCPMPTLTAGSCGFFRGTLTNNSIRSLWTASLLGTGGAIKDGFGRFKLNWSIHEFDAVTQNGRKAQ